MQQHPCAPLTEPVCYADTLIKIADTRSRVSIFPNDKPSRSAVKPGKSYAHAAMTSNNNNQKSMLDISEKTRERHYDERQQPSSLPSSYKISYCRICLEKTHLYLQFLYVLRPSDLYKIGKKFSRVSTVLSGFTSRRLVVVGEIFVEEMMG